MNAFGNGARMTWLGHSTWLLETPGGKQVLFDPFIEGNPACPDDYKNGRVDTLDLILVTHGHMDHISDLVATAKSTGAPVVAIFDLTSWLETKGVDRVIGMNKGGTLAVEGLEVTLVDAVHSSSIIEDGRPVDLGDPCGIVVTLEDGYTIYNAGDTAVFGDMRLVAELYEPDVVLLPIGDHFTMGPRQAAKAIELLGADLVVPQHYGTFPVLTGTPEQLRQLVPETVRIVTVDPGETID
jgi:L-ascorbate metabolism protein UlaG (beta-lactamase superfamily)